MISPLDLSLPEISRLLAEGCLSARELVETAQARHDPSLNAYKTWAPDFARSQAIAADAAFAAGNRIGALQGIPISTKDLYGVTGLPIFAGSPRELSQAWQRQGPLVSGLRKQLAIIMGKTHTVEFAFGGLGTNYHWPTPWNPWDRKLHRAPGGSSSGAGVSLREGTALLALATDTGGSIRIPASMTGNAGLKTTQGRWSLDGVVPLSPSLDTTGFMARSVEDLAFAFAEIDGTSVPEVDHLSGVTLGIAESFFWENTSPGVSERVTEAISYFEADGATTQDFAVPGCAEVFDLYYRGGIVAPELYSFLVTELPDWLETLDPRVRHRMDAGRALEAWEYLYRKKRHALLGAEAIYAMRHLDALICPTVPITPPPVADLADDEVYQRMNMLELRNTCVASFLGLCALTLPAGIDAKGMPVGLQLIGLPGHESRLLAIAGCMERRLRERGAWNVTTE